MKTIHLIRHAKSSWSESHLSDMDRPLNRRGQNACGIMARPILDAGCSFRNVFCSIARRTQLTMEGLAQALPEKEIEWQSLSDIYTFDWEELLDWLHGLDDSLSEVVIVGHNPALTDFTNVMGNLYVRNVPTLGYVQMTFPFDSWGKLSPASGNVVRFLTPKMVG